MRQRSGWNATYNHVHIPPPLNMHARGVLSIQHTAWPAFDTENDIFIAIGLSQNGDVSMYRYTLP